jgi:hypothetical protein
MPEYDVSHLEMEDCGQMSGSAAELGENAGRLTWNNSVQMGKDHPLVTEKDADEVRDYFRDYGAWDDEEIDAWTLDELNGLVTQEAASAFRDYESCDSYEEYQKDAEAGLLSGNLYRDDNGKWWLSLNR